MKKITLALVSALVFAACQKDEKKGNLELTGEVHGLTKGTLYVKHKKDTALVTLDSIVINGDSKFATAFDIPEPEMLYLFLDRGPTNSIDNSLAFFAEPGKMNIDTKLETFYANAKVTGSKNNDLYQSFKKIRSRFTDNELEIRAKQLKGDLTPEDVEKYEHTLRRRYLYTVNFAVSNKEYEVAPFVALSEIPDANLKYLDTINNQLSPKVKKSLYGKMLEEYVKERRKEETK